LIGVGAPQPNGTLWVLAGTPADKTLQEINLLSGKVQRIVPVAGGASTLAQSLTGTLAVGYGDSDGTVEFRDGSTGSLLSLVTVGAPVKDISAQGDTSTFFVLDGTTSVTTVNAVNSAGQAVPPAIGVALDTVALAATPDGSQIYLLEHSGFVTDATVHTGKIKSASSSFFAGKDAVQLALSDDGSNLYVLKSISSGANIGIFNVSTEEQTGVIPAPAHSTGLVGSIDGTHIYVLVGTPTVGNVQVFPIDR
jgi:WD40 repeat protein